MKDVAALFQVFDERQEEGAVDAVLVEIIRFAVGCGHHGDAAREELFEQARQDHCIRDLGDLEFVEAEQLRPGSDLFGNRRDRVIACAFDTPGRAAALCLGHLAPDVEQVLDFGHEFVEVHAALGLRGGVFEEEVHQHGLAPANPAPEVEAGHWLGL